MRCFLSRAGWMLLAAVGVLAGRAGGEETGSLRLIGVSTLPKDLRVEETLVGGLSGLDYDAAQGRWLAISDDRSENSPARTYAVRIDYDADRVRGVSVEGVTLLQQADGSLYPSKKQVAKGAEGVVPDLESVRFDPDDGSLWYTSEGDKTLGLNPFVRHATREGKFLAELALPATFRWATAEGTGPRINFALEGMSFAPDGRSLWVSFEGPWEQDGALPTPAAGAPARFTRFDRKGGVLAQYIYPLDAIPHAPGPGKFADNGVSEILAVGESELLVLERAGVQPAEGPFRFYVRLYAVQLGNATEVQTHPAIKGDRTIMPLHKRLLVDFDQLRPGLADNLECIARGPKLPNGHDTLVIVSDDNFNAPQTTQFWVFEVLPAAAPSKPAARQWDSWFDGAVHDEHRIAGFVGEYRWLSNYYECPVAYEGRRYGSSEAAYHASKFPEAERDEFTRLDPDAAKKLSRKKKVDQAWWDARKARVMREILEAKFAQNPELGAQLRATGARDLEEANWWGDTYWGTVNGEGQNVLGRILMEIRAGPAVRPNQRADIPR